MESYFAGLLYALWLGILTSISPCPLATNIAAISFIGKELGSGPATLMSGLLYTMGRVAAYFGISLLIVTSLLSVPELGRFLQKYINIILGPLLVIIGLLLLNLIKYGNIGSGKIIDKLKDRLAGRGYIGAAALGFVFALSFCPISAALFFGSLIPLALKYDSGFVFPLVYGVGTALPVIVFAFVLGFGAAYVGKLFNAISRFEWWAQRITGGLFIVIGLYLCYDNWF